jgi:hypothetical protein
MSRPRRRRRIKRVRRRKMETRFSSSDPGAGPERRGTRTKRRKRNLEGRRVRRTGAGPAVQMSKGTSTKKF